MSQFGEKHQSYLEEKFGSRVSFHKTERKLYGHDIAVLPSLMKPLLGDTTPDAVVQPETEKELVGLVRWAGENNIPLTPRGQGILWLRWCLTREAGRCCRLLQNEQDRPY